MGKGHAAPPDFNAIAADQFKAGQTNVNEATQANRPNISTPFGSQSWAQDPNTGRWSMSTGYGPQLTGAAQGLEQQAAQNFSQPLDNGSQVRDQVTNAAYGQMSSRLDPMWQQRETQMRSQLANQGLDPGSEAAQQSMFGFGRDRNDAYQGAMNSALTQGNEAQNLTFNQNMAARNMPLQDLQQMQGLLQMPGFNAAGIAPPPQYLQAALQGYQSLRDKQNNDRQQTADAINGFTSMGRSAMGAYGGGMGGGGGGYGGGGGGAYGFGGNGGGSWS